MFSWLRDRFRRGPVVPVVRLSGVIASSGLLGSRGLSIETVAPLLKRAFDMRGAKAVALAINSPGGSPVQSALIGQRIRLLAREKGLPVIAFVEDVAASGGYWLACAADEIIVDPSSIVGLDRRHQRRLRLPGSAGARSASSGASIRRANARRCSTPFSAENGRTMSSDSNVCRPRSTKASRPGCANDGAGKLEGRRSGAVQRRVLDRPSRRSSSVWSTALGDLRETLQARYGAKVHLPVIAPRRGLLSRLRLGSGHRRHRPLDAGGARGAPALADGSDFRSPPDEACSAPSIPSDMQAVRDWFDTLARHCRAVDYEARAADLRRGHDRLRHLHRLHDGPRPGRAEAVAQRLGHHPQLPLRSRQDRGHRLGRPADRGRHGRLAVGRLPSQRRPLRPARPHDRHAGPPARSAIRSSPPTPTCRCSAARPTAATGSYQRRDRPGSAALSEPLISRRAARERLGRSRLDRALALDDQAVLVAAGGGPRS